MLRILFCVTAGAVAAVPAGAVERGSPAVLLDQARALIEARGQPERASEGFVLMKRLADEAEGPTAVLAQWNVGNFYLNGIGTEPSLDAALVYLGKAEAAGMPEAATLIGRIRKY